MNSIKNISCYLLIITYLSQVSSLSFPWACNDLSHCIQQNPKNNTSDTKLYESQNICRLACGKFGGLWPRPTGTTILTPELIDLHPHFITFDTSTVPDKTKRYLKDISDIFIENIIKECHQNCTIPSKTEVLIKIFVNSVDLSLKWETDESYSLEVSTIGSRVTVEIIADTVFGIRNGFETLSQLITGIVSKKTNQYGLVMTAAAKIKDAPVFRHRGLMLDTARNFIPVKDILRTLDGMGASKLNIFHWHATDSQSFPLEIPSVPQLTRFGAYSSKHIYKQTDIKDIIKYARNRGIRVLIELDAPSHAGNGWQWGPLAGLGDLAVCVNQQPWRKYCVQPPCGQLNPANPNLYRILRNIYKDLSKAIPNGESLHLGGDEVFFGCWNSTAEIINLLKERGRGREISDFLQLWAEYQATSLRIWDDESGRSPSSRDQKGPPIPVIIWSSHLTDPKTIEDYLQKDRYIIQTWVESESDLPENLLSKGYKLIMSTKNAWYLDHGFWGSTSYYTWRTVYQNRLPRHEGVLGGETCMWSELVDGNSMDSRIWPRAAAAAERLWTNPLSLASAAEPRFYRHRERLFDRGLKPESVTPKWCVLNEGACT